MTCQSTVRIFLLILTAASAAFAQDAEKPQAPPPQALAPTKPITRIRIGGNVAQSQLIHKVAPIYPTKAIANRISGTVVLHAILAKDGTVLELQYISGPPELMSASMDAVRQWVYKPTLLNGQPVEVDTLISVLFTLDGKNHASSLPPPSTPPGPAATPPPATDAQSSARPAIDPQLKSDILRLIEVTHLKQRQTDTAHAMFESMRSMLLKSLPPTQNRDKIVDAFSEKLSALLNSDTYMDSLVGIYAKYFSDEDIKASTAFYQTPAGQHSLEIMPQLTKELFELGQQTAATNFSDIAKQLCDEFPELRGDAKFCPAGPAEKKSLLLPSPDPFSAPSSDLPPS